MSWFRRDTPPSADAPFERIHLEDVPIARNVVAFPPKPAELVEYVERDWTRASKPEPVPPAPVLVWTSDAPSEPGAYWWTPSTGGDMQKCGVLRFGTRLCITQRAGDSAMYLDVTRLHRRWAKAEES